MPCLPEDETELQRGETTCSCSPHGTQPRSPVLFVLILLFHGSHIIIHLIK